MHTTTATLVSHNIIDKVKDFWDTRPCNIRHSPNKVGTKAYFDEVEIRKYFVEPHIPRFADFERWKGKKVLEIGCGIGTDTINFARAGAKVTAVDLSEKSIEIAQQRANLYEQDIKFYCGNAEELSNFVPIDKYDLVYSFGVIHHTPQPERIVAELQKYMSPTSIFKIMVYFRYSWKVFWILMKYGKGAFWKLDKLISSFSEAQFGCPVTHTYSKNKIKALLKSFTILEQQVTHIFPYKISKYRNYQYDKVWYFKYLPSSLFSWLEHHYGWHLCVTASLKQS